MNLDFTGEYASAFATFTECLKVCTQMGSKAFKTAFFLATNLSFITIISLHNLNQQYLLASQKPI